MKVHRVTYKQDTFILDPPLEILVTKDDEFLEGTSSDSLFADWTFRAKSLSRLRHEIARHIEFLWDAFACEMDSNMSEAAQLLANQVRARISTRTK
jgi:hypothetical protein